MINDSVEKEIGSLAWPGYSPPGLGFRTPEDRSGSVFSQREKRRTHPNGTRALSTTLGEAWETEERGRRGWRDPACPNCRHSAAASITTAEGLFLQSLCDSAGQTSETLARRKERSKEQKGKNPRLKAQRAEKRRKVFFFFFLSVLVTPTRRLSSSLPAGAQTLWLDICQVSVKRAHFNALPLSPPPSHPLHPPSPSPPVFLLTCWQGGTVVVTQAGFMKSVGEGSGVVGGGKKQKRHLSIPPGNTLRSTPPPTYHPVLTASLGMHLSDA